MFQWFEICLPTCPFSLPPISLQPSHPNPAEFLPCHDPLFNPNVLHIPHQHVQYIYFHLQVCSQEPGQRTGPLCCQMLQGCLSRRGILTSNLMCEGIGSFSPPARAWSTLSQPALPLLFPYPIHSS